MFVLHFQDKHHKSYVMPNYYIFDYWSINALHKIESFYSKHLRPSITLTIRLSHIIIQIFPTQIFSISFFISITKHNMWILTLITKFSISLVFLVIIYMFCKTFIILILYSNINKCVHRRTLCYDFMFSNILCKH